MPNVDAEDVLIMHSRIISRVINENSRKISGSNVDVFKQVAFKR